MKGPVRINPEQKAAMDAGTERLVAYWSSPEYRAMRSQWLREPQRSTFDSAWQVRAMKMCKDKPRLWHRLHRLVAAIVGGQ